jgi:predicted site-specific integrase-resolvase
MATKTINHIGLADGPARNLITKSNAAARFAICPHTLMRWVRAGRLAVIRLNSRVVRFDPQEIQRLIDISQ